MLCCVMLWISSACCGGNIVSWTGVEVGTGIFIAEQVVCVGRGERRELSG